MMDNLFTWEALATLAGASAITYLIVAYTKRLVDAFWPPVLGTDIYAVLIGFLVLLATTGALGHEMTWASVVLALFNGFLVAATSGKMSDKAIDESDRKRGE
jgi:divalent metal cation (Fe/Co/Zn/Cd) transporter